jgi:hypothetical protein
MTGGGRADPFGELDVSGFAPAKPAPKANAEAVRKVAENASFPSREAPTSQEPKPEAKAPRPERRVYRTGRTAQFTCKADPRVVGEFYAICNEREWVMGETLRRAVEALSRELARDPRSPFDNRLDNLTTKAAISGGLI